MSATAEQAGLQARATSERARPAGGVLFDWAAIVVGGLIVGGFYLDAWAHSHGKTDNTFFTPWHAVLYSGLFIAILAAAGVLVWNHSREYAWSRALPAGYDLSLLGIALFMLGGLGDLAWHEIFGVELELDAAFSPTHILLVVAVTLIVTGPVRAYWHRNEEARGPAEWLPIILSLGLTLSVLTVITQWLHPFVQPWAGQNLAQTTGSNEGLAAAGVWVQTGLLMGVVLFALRRWSLPFGSLTLVFTFNAVLLSFMRDQYRFIPVALVAGLVADLLVMWLKPSSARPMAFHLFAFLVPVVLFTLYFLVIITTEGIAWTVHMWTGTVVTAGVVGLLLSYLMVPPALPEQRI